MEGPRPRIGKASQGFSRKTTSQDPALAKKRRPGRLSEAAGEPRLWFLLGCFSSKPLLGNPKKGETDLFQLRLPVSGSFGRAVGDSVQRLGPEQAAPVSEPSTRSTKPHLRQTLKRNGRAIFLRVPLLIHSFQGKPKRTTTFLEVLLLPAVFERVWAICLVFLKWGLAVNGTLVGHFDSSHPQPIEGPASENRNPEESEERPKGRCEM